MLCAFSLFVAAVTASEAVVRDGLLAVLDRSRARCVASMESRCTPEPALPRGEPTAAAAAACQTPVAARPGPVLILHSFQNVR